MPLDEMTLIDFALDHLDAPERQAIERELASSPALQAELRTIEETFTAVALSVKPVRPSQQVRTRLFASLHPQTRFAGFVERVAQLFDLSLERAQELLQAIQMAPAAPWEVSPIPGIRLFHFESGPQVAAAENCGLVHMEPGSIFPPHQHVGDEWALVLQGRCQEDSGKIFGLGDLIYKKAGSEHSFRVLGDEPFVFAVVLYGGLQILPSP